MSLIVTNTTGADIEISELGLTVPASGTYDLSHRPPQVVAASDELAGHITSGNIVVTTDTLNVLANAVGYLRMPSPTGPVAFGALDNAMYVQAPGDYKFSAASYTYNFATANAHNNTWMQPHSDIIGSGVGQIAVYPVRVIGVQGFCSNPNTTKTIWLYIDGVQYMGDPLLTFTSGDNFAVAYNIGIDVSVGQKLRFRVKSDQMGPLGAVNCSVIVSINFG